MIDFQPVLRGARLALVAVASVALASLLLGARPAGDAKGHQNRLAAEASPYLRMHASNPVDWYPWGDEAFARAREQDKPIFLSVGYSTCYWCHVMEREVFTNEDIAALMNEHFVNVKVDREERPDIDEIYMAVTQLMTGAGGWPNSLFLTPSGEPFFAGTYFPPEDEGTRPGFPSVLRQLAAAWRERRDDVLSLASRTRSEVETRLAAVAPSGAPVDTSDLLARASRQLAASYETRHGGFSTGAKFPSPAKLEILLADDSDAATEMLSRTLDEMALGGIHDHVGGGFHRYATEPSWSIPHFEKMLYDNAQLLSVYSRAHAKTGRTLYRDVAEGIARYLQREMRHPEGGFYAAQDAEVDGHEGASYVWTRAELEAVLGEARAAELLRVYELRPLPEGEGGALRVKLPLAPALARREVASAGPLLAGFAEDRAKLLRRRDARARPLRDDKVLAAWNGLAIRGFVDAARALGEASYLAVASACADQVMARLAGEGGRLHRSYIGGSAREVGVLSDYAFVADGLLVLHRATGDADRLRQARALVDRMLEDFEDPAAGGFFLTPADTELFARPRPLLDDVEPSASGVALRVLIDLHRVTGIERYAEAARRALRAFAGAFRETPALVGSAVVALRDSDLAPTPVQARAAAERPASAMPRSANFVAVSARTAEHPDALVVLLSIDDGFHVNANPATLAFLIPTSVEIEGAAQPVAVAYPPGTLFEPSFAREALSTYLGEVEIPVRLAPGSAAAAEGIRVRYQACDETRCLPPSTTRIAMP